MPLQPGKINVLLPFADNASESAGDIIGQDAYSSDGMRRSGVLSETEARRDLQNKQARQGSFAASMLGQFTGNRTTVGVPDDVDVDSFETQFVNALLSFLIESGTVRNQEVLTQAQWDALTDEQKSAPGFLCFIKA